MQEINAVKFEACNEFQNDYNSMTKIVNEAVIFPYLLSARSSKFGRKLQRSESGAIARELLSSKDFVLSKLHDDNPIESQMIEELHDNFVAMKLV